MVVFDAPATAAVAVVVLGAAAAAAVVVARRESGGADMVDVQAVEPGSVRTHGRVERLDGGVPSLMAGDDRRPVLLSYQVDRRPDGSSEDEAWETVAAGVEGTSFVLAGEGEHVVVDPGNVRGQQVELGSEHTTRHRVTRAADSPVKDDYEDADPGAGERRYVERAVYPGQRITVSGTCNSRTLVGGRPAYVIENDVSGTFLGDRTVVPDDPDPSSNRLATGIAGVLGLFAAAAALDLVLILVG